MTETALLTTVVDIQGWLRLDRETPLETRQRRDRQIGRDLADGDDVSRVLSWWRVIEAGLPEAPVAGRRMVILRRYLLVLLSLAGLVVGLGVGAAAFAYDGAYPVNLFVLLGVLVGLPGLLLLLTLMALIGRIPGLHTLREAFGALSLSRWAGVWLDRAGGVTLFSDLQQPFANVAFARWQLTGFGQWFAVGFFAGVLALALTLVAATDLAFGWSTTLQISPDSVHGAFALLAAPWAAWLPAATPDATLVEASRYYRLEQAQVPLERITRLGDWWPFVLMAIAAYGLLPRLLLLLLCAWRVAAATRGLLLDDPEVTALLDRLVSPNVGFAAQPEDNEQEDEGAGQAPVELLPDATMTALIWNDALTPERASRWLERRSGQRPGAVLELGVLRSGPAGEQLSRLTPAVRQIVIFCKGWEPPLLEFSDFVSQVRELLGSEASLMVVPVSLDGEEVLAADRDIWARTMARQKDPKLYVVAATAGAPA